MPSEIEALGAVVIGNCDLHIEGICKYNTEVGAVLVFNDSTQKQWNVCKNCSDHMFRKGEWYKKGEKPLPTNAPTSKLQNFVSEIITAKNNNEKMAIAGKYATERWILSVPITVGMYSEPYFVVEVNIGALGWITIAFESEDESTPAVVKVRPFKSIEELTKSEGSILFVEERIR